MGSLLAKILPLALGGAISPVLLGISVLTLTGRSHPRARAWAVAAGAAVVITALGVVILVFLRGAVYGGGDTHSATSAAVDLFFGAVLLLLGLVTALRKPGPPKKQDQAGEDRAGQPARLGRYFALGAGAMVTNLTTLILFFPAVKEIGASHLAVTQEVLALVVVIAIVMLPATVPPLLDTIAPRTGARVLAGLNRFLTRHRRKVRIVLCLGFGAYLAFKGIRGL